jgi:Predicted nucleotidyltransferases
VPGKTKTFFTIKNNQIIDYICVMRNSNKIIDEILRMANSKYPDSEIYLYGSQARGDSKKYSDWDLLILLNQQNISFALETKVMDDFYDVELETGAIISPLIYSKFDWDNRHSMTPLYENIKNEGIRIK